MATARRIAVFFIVSIGCAISGIIYYRVGVAHLFPMARGDSSGPWTSVITTLELIVPVALVALVLFTGIWAMAGGAQEERARVRGGRR